MHKIIWHSGLWDADRPGLWMARNGRGSAGTRRHEAEEDAKKTKITTSLGTFHSLFSSPLIWFLSAMLAWFPFSTGSTGLWVFLSFVDTTVIDTYDNGAHPPAAPSDAMRYNATQRRAVRIRTRSRLHTYVSLSGEMTSQGQDMIIPLMTYGTTQLFDTHMSLPFYPCLFSSLSLHFDRLFTLSLSIYPWLPLLCFATTIQLRFADAS